MREEGAPAATSAEATELGEMPGAHLPLPDAWYSPPISILSSIVLWKQASQELGTAKGMPL